MPDLSSMSTDELLALHQQLTSPPPSPPGSVDLSQVPTDQLLKMHKQLSTPVAAKPEGVDVGGLANSAMRGVAQGSTLGFADELAAGAGGLKDYVAGKMGLRGDISLPDAYHSWRDVIRKADAKAEAEHPGVYTGGQIAGGVATAFAPGLAALNIGKGAGAAEILGKGALMGSVAGAGGANNVTDVPAEMVRGGLTGAVLSGGLAAAGKGLGKVVEKAGPFAAKVFGGINPETLAKYSQNADRINSVGALPEEAVKDAVDSGVSRVIGDRNALATRADDLEGILNQAYAQKQTEIAGAVTPLAKAKEMTASLQSQKTYLGSLSEQADDALERSGAVFEKKHLIEAIDKIGADQGSAIVGDEAHAALDKLRMTRERIADGLPDQIPAAQMRSVLQQLRKDVSFDQGAGEFNDTLNGMRKEFTSQISNALKKQVPEYADYMSRMEALSKNLGTMNRYFGDESKALGSLESLRKGGARAQIIQDALQNHATVNADQSLLGHLDQVNQSHALLDRIKAGEDLRPHLFPKAWNALQEAQAESQMGASVASPIERLGQNRTQAVIRNQGGKIPSIEDRRALEALSQSEGTNFPQMIDDKNVFDAFQKGNTTGARGVAMGTAMGSGLGYLVAGPTGAAAGASVGGLIGGTLDKYGPAIVKGTVDSAQALQKVLNDSQAVKQLGPYARPLLEAASKGNQTLAATNQALLSSDPIYRSMFKTDPHQQKRDAISRRLGE